MEHEAKIQAVAAAIRSEIAEQVRGKFDLDPDDGTFWCPDSNASLDPREIAEAVLRALDEIES